MTTEVAFSRLSFRSSIREPILESANTDVAFVLSDALELGGRSLSPTFALDDEFLSWLPSFGGLPGFGVCP